MVTVAELFLLPGSYVFRYFSFQCQMIYSSMFYFLPMKFTPLLVYPHSMGLILSFTFSYYYLFLINDSKSMVQHHREVWSNKYYLQLLFNKFQCKSFFFILMKVHLAIPTVDFHFTFFIAYCHFSVRCKHILLAGNPWNQQIITK